MSESGKRNGRILLFGGTTEGRLLTQELLRDNFQVILCVATEYGQELAGQAGGLQIRTGRLNQEEMEALLRQEKPDLVIDATHPYAREVTANIFHACERTGRKRFRCLRQSSQEEGEQEIWYFNTMQEAADWLRGQEGAVLLTTGSKELACFCQMEDYRERLYARVLPLEESVRVCRGLGLSGRHILAVQGPFSEEMNYAQLREYGCRILVTKDGGAEGGFSQKLAAARRAGVRTAVIRRPGESGLSVREILERVREQLNESEGEEG